MPALKTRSGRLRTRWPLLLASLAFAHVAPAQQTPAQTVARRPTMTKNRRPQEGAIQNSDLDSPLFHQLLIGEIELRDGELAESYQFMLDAARRTPTSSCSPRDRDRVQGRAGDEALAAVDARGARPNRSKRCVTRFNC